MPGYYARVLITSYHFDADVYIARSQLPVARAVRSEKDGEVF
jgi:hypothetical protein